MLTEEGQGQKNVCVPVTVREPDMEEGQGETEETRTEHRGTAPSPRKEGKRQRRRKNAWKLVTDSRLWDREFQDRAEALAAQRPMELRTEKRILVLET